MLKFIVDGKEITEDEARKIYADKDGKEAKEIEIKFDGNFQTINTEVLIED